MHIGSDVGSGQKVFDLNFARMKNRQILLSDEIQAFSYEDEKHILASFNQNCRHMWLVTVKCLDDT